jgi:TonB family protein
LEAILAHEIGHIKRYDYLVNMLQMLVETLLFYHPAVWWTSKKIRIERELCCDDLAVRFSGNALRYARALTTLEKLRLRAPGVAMASTGGPLLYRIQRLAGISAKEYGPSRVPTMLVIALGFVCFALNVPGMQGQDAAGVRVDLGASSVIHRSPVPYPEAAQKQGITGTVQIEVKLDSIGNVADARVLTGPEELRKAALESVLNWHFTSDAARGTRLISILFSDQGKQVKVQEPLSVEDQERRKVAIAMAEADAKKAMLAAAELAAKEKEMQVVLTRRQQLEREIGAVQSKLQESNSTPEQLDALKAKLNALRAEFEATPRPGGGGRGNPSVGRMLKSISTPGFNDSVRADLISRLPIREGDTLSPQLLEQTSQAVRSYDEHLRVQFLPTDDGKAELRIVANERR